LIQSSIGFVFKLNHNSQMDMSGKLGFEDYKRLWADLLLCKVSDLCTDLQISTVN